MKNEEVEVMEEVASKGAITRYMQEVNMLPVLTDEECLELGAMLKNNETRSAAKDRLVEGNLRLVIKIAMDWKGKGLPLEDLIAVGNLGLMNAAEKFDIDCGKKFSTYALWWIRVSMSRAVEGSHTVRIPVASSLKKRNVLRFIESFKQKFSREPSVEELKKGLGYSDVEMRHIGQLENFCVSMNEKFDNEDGDSDEIGDVIANQSTDSVLDEIVKREEIEALHKAIAQLDQREKTIILMRYGIGNGKEATLDTVALKVGLTKERVRHIQKIAES